MKACLFDLDGVIVDTAVYHYKAWRRMANELGFDFTEEQNEQLKGVSRMESLDLILGWGGVTLSDEEKQKWAARKNEWYLEYIHQMTPAEILPGVETFLESLRKAGIGIGLGSASKNARLILEQIGMIDSFDVIIDGTHITKSKPDPEVFLLGAKAFNLSPADCIVFEDAVAGIEAAHRGGMKAVGVGSPEVLTQADIVISSFTETSLSKLSDELTGWQ